MTTFTNKVVTIVRCNVKASDIAGIGTALLVMAIAIIWVNTNSNAQYKLHLPILYAGFAVYIASFILVSRNNRIPINGKYTLLVIQLASAFTLLYFFPIEFFPILTIIWVSILPHYFSFSRSMMIMLAVVTAWFSLDYLLWHKRVIYSALLYGAFHFFAMLMAVHTRRAERATEEAKRLNKELQATQHLLSEASKLNERTRIARDLHDLLGHHLTALIINLQVAGHITSGEAKDKVKQCYSLAKLLLSDVRDAVSTLRENQSLDIQSMINLMAENIPNLKIHSEIEPELSIDNIDLAKTLLRCIQEAITNCLRHANATELWLKLSHCKGKLLLEIIDNGKIIGKLKLGNGLKGLQERVAELRGEVQFSTNQKALKIRICLPLEKT